MYADRLACVPEVTTILALLDDTRLIGQRGLLLDDFDWPDDWRLEAADRHRGLASLCADDAELVLLIAAAWERVDPEVPPWSDSSARQDWARQWWVNHSTLLEAARQRRDVLGSLSPAMKEEVKRFLEPALIDRARGVLTRALAAQEYIKVGEGQYRPLYASQRQQPELIGQAEETPNPAPPGPATQPAVLFALEDDTLVVPVDRVIALRRRESKNDNRISSLVIAQHWAQTEPGAQPPTGVADAMRLVVAASRSAPADPAKTSVLSYLASWPVGQRVRVDLAAEGDSMRAMMVSEPLAPFRRPKGSDEREDDAAAPRRKDGRRPRRAQRLNDESDGTTDDLKVEIRLDGRRGYDDEGRAAAQFLQADQAVEAPAACGQCFPCQDGRPEDCEDAADPSRQGKREDPVVSWRRKAQVGEDVSIPRVSIEAQPFDSAGWYEITGYHRDADGYAVTLRPDWRRGQPGNAAQHPDLTAGDSVDVRVGRELRHHGGALREFHRVDGRGRFVLAEASSRYADVQEKRREIAVSLDRGNTTLLKGLREGQVIANVTVVPARAAGTVTITLLELLHQHWAKAQDGRGAENHVLDKTRRNAHVVRVYPATVEQPPNENGYATARLLHQDSSLGVIHRIDFRVSAGRQADEADGASAESAVPTLNLGDAVLLNLVSDRASLDVSGLDVGELRAIEKSSAGQLRIDGLPDDGHAKRSGEPNARPRQRDTEPDEDDQTKEEERLAPSGTTIKANTDRPLPRSAAISLVGLSDELDWPNEVWAFWARSHHLKPGDRPPYLPGTQKEPFDVPAAVTVNTRTPIEQQRAALAAFAADHPLYSIIECTVQALVKSGVFVDLGHGLEGFIPLEELTWTGRLSHSDQAAHIGDRVRALVTALRDPPEKPQLSIKKLTPDPYQQFKAQHSVGDRLEVTVTKIVDTRAFVDLGGAVDGSIHISQIDHEHVADIGHVLSQGDTVTVDVIKFDDERRNVEVSRKATIPKPYEVYKRRHSVGEQGQSGRGQRHAFACSLDPLQRSAGANSRQQPRMGSH